MMKLQWLLYLFITLLLLLFFFILSRELPYLFTDWSTNSITVHNHNGPRGTGMSGIELVGSGVLSQSNGQELLFLGGGLNQPDVILHYHYPTKTIRPLLELQKNPKTATFCCALGSLKDSTDPNYSLEDIVVGRSDGVYVLWQEGPLQFKAEKIHQNELTEIPSAISLGDYNRSGRLSIFITNYIHRKYFQPLVFGRGRMQPNYLLRNQGQRQFVDVTNSLNLRGNRNTWTGAFIDLNHNGFPDLVIANDEGPIDIYQNQGTYFNKVSLPYEGYWMSLGVGDYDRSGYPSLFFTNIGASSGFLHDLAMILLGRSPAQIPSSFTQKHVLVKNHGGYQFEGIESKPSSPPLPGYAPFGWGAIFHDYNLDGHLDLLYSTGWTVLPWHRLAPLRDAGVVWDNRGQANKSFKKVSRFENRQFSQTPLAVDFLGQGEKQIVWVNHFAPIKVYRPASSELKKKRWLNVHLPRNARTANARLILEEVDGQQQYRQLVLGGTGLGATESSILQFGLGSKRQPKRLRLHLTSGETYSIEQLQVNRLYQFSDFQKNN